MIEKTQRHYVWANEGVGEAKELPVPGDHWDLYARTMGKEYI